MADFTISITGPVSSLGSQEQSLKDAFSLVRKSLTQPAQESENWRFVSVLVKTPEDFMQVTAPLGACFFICGTERLYYIRILTHSVSQSLRDFNQQLQLPSGGREDEDALGP